MVGPWIHSLWQSGRRLSDIEYLAIKEFDGKTRQVDGTATAAGTIATITAASGKDMYLSGAKISIGHNNSLVSNVFGLTQVDLYINGTIVESCVRSSLALSGGAEEVDYEFNTKGVKVAATQIIKLELAAINNTREIVSGVINVFEEATGDSPAI